MSPTNKKQGMILIIVISFLTALVLLATTVAVMLNLDTRQTGFVLTGVQAFQNADAGADYVLARLKQDEITGVLTVRGANVAVNYAAPSGYNFDTVTNIVRLPNPRLYAFRVIGHSGTARAIIDVTVGRAPIFMVGAFGNEEVSLGPTTEIHGYNSDDGLVPTNATGAATVASNEELDAKADAVDGTIYLGEDPSGVPATYAHEFTTPSDVVRVGRINPDPLGAIGGDLAKDFAHVAVSNDNASAVGGSISGGQLKIAGDITLAAGSYYVSEIDLGNGKTLTVDASAGPVKLYMTAGATTMPNSMIIVNPSKPENLQIYSAGTDEIRLQPNNDLVAIVYAPYATIGVQPNGDFLGMLWANQLDIQPNGVFYLDEDAVHLFDGDQPLVRAFWKHVVD